MSNALATADEPALSPENWMDRCDNRERLFIARYLATLNVRQSALDAGYSESVATTWAYYWVKPYDGPRLSDPKFLDQTKRHVYQAIRLALDLRASEDIVSADLVLRRLRSIATADMRRLVTVRATEVEDEVDGADGEGGEALVVRHIHSHSVTVKPSEEWDDDIAAAVKEIRTDKDGNVIVKLHDANTALMALGKHLGIMDDRVRHLGPNGGPVAVINGDMNTLLAAEAYKALLEG